MWNKKQLSDVCTIKKGSQVNRTALSHSGDYYVLNGGMEPSGYLDRYNTEANTISISEGGNSCGYVAYNTEPFWSGGHNYTLSELEIEKLYLYYFLKCNESKIMNLRVGSGLPNIQRKMVEAFPVYYPVDIKEQSHIATVLNASDQAITSSRELVEKYSAIKQGLMHDLFNPLARDTALGDTGTWYGGITPSMNNPRYWGEGHFWLSSGEVKSATLDRSTRKITDSALANTTLRLLPKGTIVVVVRSGILKNYFPVAELQTPMAINQDLKGIVLQEGINSKYILYVLEFFGDEILRKCMKAGTTVQSVELKWLKAFKIPLPEAKEQDRIVEILTAVNERLIAEQQRLRKLEDIKRGLMNDLLTNRVSTDQLQGGV